MISSGVYVATYLLCTNYSQFNSQCMYIRSSDTIPGLISLLDANIQFLRIERERGGNCGKGGETNTISYVL